MKEKLKVFVQSFPEPIQYSLGSVYGSIPYSWREGQIYRETLRFLQDTQNWSKEKLKEYQFGEIFKLLKHSYINVPYYRNLFDKHGINIQKIQNFSDLKVIPFLTKEIIRENLDDLRARNFDKSFFEPVTTGGSSGTPLSFFMQRGYSRPRENAFIAAIWQRIGYSMNNDKRMILRGPIVDNNSHMQYKPASKELICSTYHLVDEHILSCLERMKSDNIQYIHGHISSVTLFARFLIENETTYPLKAVLGASEKVFSFQREMINKAFQCRLFTWYGQSEQVVLAGECEFSNQYHIQPEYGFTELIDKVGNQIQDGDETGEIVGTSFNNFVMPLIRYRTGDIGRYGSGSCPCGREFDLFDRIDGRIYEYIWTKDNRKISLTGLIFGQHYKAFERIEKMQIAQEEKGEIEIRIVQSRSYTQQDEMEIRSVITKAVQSGLQISFNYLDEINATNSGKHQFLIQNINN